MDEYYALIILNFIEENWSAFEQRADEAGEDLEKILEALKKGDRGVLSKIIHKVDF